MADLTKSLTRLRSDFSTTHPKRLKDSDGWIGDPRHQQSPSAHNPDDTPGSRPESEDTDSTPEVRGLDVDKDLDGPGTPQAVMRGLLDEIIRTAADARRLNYMIFARKIAVRSEGWIWRQYVGDSTHDEHAHFSGNPAYDHDDSPWTSVRGGGIFMDWNDKIGGQTGNDGRTFADVARDYAKLREWAIAPSGTKGLPWVPAAGSPLRQLEQIPEVLQSMETLEREQGAIVTKLDKLAEQVSLVLDAVTKPVPPGESPKVPIPAPKK